MKKSREPNQLIPTVKVTFVFPDASVQGCISAQIKLDWGKMRVGTVLCFSNAKIGISGIS